MTANLTAPSSTAAAKPTAPAVKRVSLTGIGAKKPAAATDSKYPILPDDKEHEVSSLATAIRADQEQFDALEGALKVNKARLRALASPFFFATNHDKATVPSSVRCQMTAPESDAPDSPRLVVGAVNVTFINKYPAADEAAVAEVIGAELVAAYFKQQFKIEIDGDKIPAESVETVVAELQELFERHGCLEALSSAEKVVPIADFHAARHTRLTVAQNAALELVLPCQAQVKTKNVK